MSIISICFNQLDFKHVFRQIHKQWHFCFFKSVVVLNVLLVETKPCFILPDDTRLYPVVWINPKFYWKKWSHHVCMWIQGKSEGFDSCDRPSNLTQIGLKWLIFARVTLKFDGRPPKIIRHVFYTASSFVYHFRSINEFKLELQSENAQFGSNSTNFLAVWPCNLMYDLEKKNKAPLLCYFKLCASFRSHRWFQIGDTVRKRPISVKIDDS